MAPVEDYFEERHVRLGGVRIHGPRRTRDTLVRGVVQRAFADADADRRRAGGLAPAAPGELARGGAPITTVLDALRRSTAALHAITSITEARFVVVPAQREGIHGGEGARWRAGFD
jgi:hypothetical protein